MSRLKKVLLSLAVVLVLVVAIVGYGLLKIMGYIQFGPYDHEAPVIPKMTKPAVLVLSKANGFVHVDALPAAETMLKGIAKDNAWDIYITDNAAAHNAEDLARFDVVVWNNVSGDVLTKEQRAAFRTWVEQGGGWVGIHASAGDFHYKWGWYADTLLGAQFVGHTMAPQFQDADVHITDRNLNVTSHLSSVWQVPSEEWYAFDQNPRAKGYEILLTVDESSYITNDKTLFMQERMEGEHPIAWRHSLEQGRALYSAIGHQASTYKRPEFIQFIRNAIAWAGQMPSSEEQ